MTGPFNTEWQLIATAPVGRDLELAVIDGGAIHAIVFPCRRDRLGWVRVGDHKAVDVRPTHWREWKRLE